MADIAYSVDANAPRPITYDVERTMRGLDPVPGGFFWNSVQSISFLKGARPPARCSWIVDHVFASVQGFAGNEAGQKGADPYYLTDNLHANIDWRTAGGFPYGAIFLNSFAQRNLVHHFPCIGRTSDDGAPIYLQNPIKVGDGERLIFAFAVSGFLQCFPGDAITIGVHVAELPEPTPGLG